MTIRSQRQSGFVEGAQLTKTAGSSFGKVAMKVVNATDEEIQEMEVDDHLPGEGNSTASDIKAQVDIASPVDVICASILPELGINKDENESTIVDFREWNGMAAILPEVWDAVGFGDTDGVNGWAVLALTVGINEVATRISSNLDTISLISGLLLASCVQLMFAPPSCISDNDDGFRYAFAGTMTLAITMFFSAIMFGSLFVNALNTSARDSDRWRLIIHRSMAPTLVYTVFSIACFLLGWAMSLGMVCLYGGAIAAIFSIVITGVCGVLMHCINVKFLVSESHVVHGWFAKHRSEFDLQLPYIRLKKLADIDARYQKQNAGTKRISGTLSRPKYGLFPSRSLKLPTK